jgi:hypothetical protein
MGLWFLFFQFCGWESLAIFFIYCKFTLRKRKINFFLVAKMQKFFKKNNAA